MLTQPKLRSVLCFCLILFVHVVIVLVLIVEHNSKQKNRLPSETTVSTVWIMPEVKVQKNNPVVEAARHSVASKPTTITARVHEPISPAPEAEHSITVDDAPLQPAPNLDLDALRAQAVQQELGREKSPIELLNEANKKNNSLEARVEDGTNKAQRPDCRTAHSGAGLFAPLMIAADLIRDKGCKF